MIVEVSPSVNGTIQVHQPVIPMTLPPVAQSVSLTTPTKMAAITNTTSASSIQGASTSTMTYAFIAIIIVAFIGVIYALTRKNKLKAI